MITYPTNPRDYRAIPWTDANGLKWIARILPSGSPQWSQYEAAGGGTALTSYVDQVAALSDYPAAFPPASHTHTDLTNATSAATDETLVKRDADAGASFGPLFASEFRLPSAGFGNAQIAALEATVDHVAYLPARTGNVVLTTNAEGYADALVDGLVTGYSEASQSPITLGATATLSLTGGTIITATLTSATACTLTAPAVVAGKSFLLYLRQPATGTVTTAAWAASPAIVWAGGTAPVVTATLGRQDIISFVANQSGTKWFGSYIQNFVY